MKKINIITFIHTICIFLICIIVSCVNKTTPLLLQNQIFAFKLNRGIYFFLDLLPPIFLSGITFACCVQWKKYTDSITHRFSAEMLKIYRNVFIVSLILVAILTLNNEIFLPMEKANLEKYKRSPYELNEAKENAMTMYEEEKYLLALQYAEQACRISPRDQSSKDLLKMIKDKVEIEHGKELFDRPDNNSEIVYKKETSIDKTYTPSELLKKSQEAFDEKNYFNAHYWATLALEVCNGTDTNREKAQEMQIKAWKMLQQPVEYNTKEQNAYYLRKREGYTAFNNQDYLKAYYIFNELDTNNADYIHDSDIDYYLARSREEVLNQYFFLDEIEDIDTLKTMKDIHFKTNYADGSYSILYIKDAFDIKKSGSYIRYGQGFNLVHYDCDGKFCYSIQDPYVKIFAQGTQYIPQEIKESVGIHKKWKYVPVILLNSVDRETKGIACTPTYSFEETGIPGVKTEISKNPYDKKIAETNILILPMDYSDLSFVTESAAGPDNLSIPKVQRFSGKAVRYGFASEPYNESLVSRVCWPFFMMAIFIFCCSIGWNFRIQNEKTMFKAVWIIMFPVYAFAMFVVYDCLIFMFNSLNFVLVSSFGNFAYIFALIVYILFFILNSIYFVGRKS